MHCRPVKEAVIDVALNPTIKHPREHEPQIKNSGASTVPE